MSAANRVPAMIRGSVVVQRRRCGKSSCYCADTERRHESTALSYSSGGRNRTVMLAQDQVEAVRAAVEAYRAAQSALLAQAEQGLAELLADTAARRSR